MLNMINWIFRVPNRLEYWLCLTKTGIRDARCGIREFKQYARDDAIEDLHWGLSILKV